MLSVYIISHFVYSVNFVDICLLYIFLIQLKRLIFYFPNILFSVNHFPILKKVNIRMFSTFVDLKNSKPSKDKPNSYSTIIHI